MLLSFQGSLTVCTVLKFSLPPLLRPGFCRAVTDGSEKWTHANLVDTLLFNSRKLVKVIGVEILSVFSECHHFMRRENVSGHYANETLEVIFSVSL